MFFSFLHWLDRAAERRLARLAAATFSALLFAAPGTAATTLYHCVDASGASVFTDTTVQLQRCRPLETQETGEPASSGSASRARVAPPPRVGCGPPGVPALPEIHVTVPIERVGNLLIIAARVNGTRQTRLILDTGASHTILSPSVAADLGLYGDPQARFVTLKTAGGPVQAEIVRLESIGLADAEVRDSLAAIYELPDAPPGVEGLLGLTFLKQFQVTLDAAGGILHLRRPGRR